MLVQLRAGSTSLTLFGVVGKSSNKLWGLKDVIECKGIEPELSRLLEVECKLNRSLEGVRPDRSTYSSGPAHTNFVSLCNRQLVE